MAKKIRVIKKNLVVWDGLLSWGTADEKNRIIEINKHQGQFEFLDTLIHEYIHIRFPKLTEKQVERLAGELTQIIWKQGYRKKKKKLCKK